MALGVGNALNGFPTAGLLPHYRGRVCRAPADVAPIQAMIKGIPASRPLSLFRARTRHPHRDPPFFLLAPKAGQVLWLSRTQRDPDRRNYQRPSIAAAYFLADVLMFVIVVPGLMLTANLKPNRVDWKVTAIPVTLIAMTMTP